MCCPFVPVLFFEKPSASPSKIERPRCELCGRYETVDSFKAWTLLDQPNKQKKFRVSIKETCPGKSSLTLDTFAPARALLWTRSTPQSSSRAHARIYSTRVFTQATIASPNPPSPPPAGRDNTLAWVGLGLAALGVAVCMYAAYHLLCLRVKAKRRQAQAAVSTDFFVRRQHEGSEPPTGMPVVIIAIPPSTDPQPATEASPQAEPSQTELAAPSYDSVASRSHQEYV